MDRCLAGTCAALVLAGIVAPSVASAQSQFVRTGNGTVSAGAQVQVAPGADAASAGQRGGAADVPWEERSVEYHGGAIPPGAQLDERTNGGMVGGGATAMVIGYLVSLAGLPYGAVPIVGPLLVIGGVNPTPPTGTGIAAMVFSEVLQLGGIALFTAGLFFPRRTLVYDTPVTAPRTGAMTGTRAHPVRWSVMPAAPGATFGLSLVVVNF
ncbi:MAG: hypothetical protein WCJ30_28905 [Deltaproteobacteria bacterium]